MRRKYKVLLAEDELAVSRLLQRYLQMIGLDVVAATNGREALDLYRAGGLSEADSANVDGHWS